MNAEFLGQLQEISATSPAAFGPVPLAGLLVGVVARINAARARARVRQAEVSFDRRQAWIRYNEHAVSEARLREVIAHGGFEVAGRS